MTHKRLKLPEDPQRRKQVKTYIARNGRDGYQKAGSKGGQNSPMKFDSDRGREAALRMHQIRRQKLAQAAREEQSNGNKTVEQQDQT